LAGRAKHLRGSNSQYVLGANASPLQVCARGLVVDLDGGSDGGPIEEPGRVGDVEVDTAVADGGAEGVVPVGAVDGKVAVVVHGVGDIGGVVVWTNHVGVTEFDVDVEGSGQGEMAGLAAGDKEGINRCGAFPGGEGLVGEVDFDPACAVADGRDYGGRG